MKRYFFVIAALLTCTVAFAGRVRSVDIKVDLQSDGSARIVEVWDINQNEGTEWYLVKSNLDGADIVDFHVTDETGRFFFSDGRSWDIHRSLKEKDGRYGMVRKSNGYELCWGLGSYGDHVFTVSYVNTALVRSLTDYDYIHEQFVSPGLSASPEKVTVTVSLPDTLSLSERNARIYGFGFEGEVVFRDGKVVLSSSAPMTRENSVILLMGLNKGILSPSLQESGLFQQRLDMAFEGSSYVDGDDDSFMVLFIGAIAGFILFILLIFFGTRARNKNILGVTRVKLVDSTRVVPFAGDLLQTNYVLKSLGLKSDSDAGIATAFILRMVQKGILLVRKVDQKHIEISFNDSADMSGLSAPETELFDMMKKASGSDMILQDKEFSRWSSKHAAQVDKWLKTILKEGHAAIVSNGYASWGGTFTEAGRQEARNSVGFKKFLCDYTLIDERRTQEAVVWEDYLVFGALYGIAEKVAKELADINPKSLPESMQSSGSIFADPVLTRNLIWSCNRLSHSITNQAVSHRSAGHGGSSSIGGGGGFHGGGFGGGAR